MSPADAPIPQAAIGRDRDAGADVAAPGARASIARQPSRIATVGLLGALLASLIAAVSLHASAARAFGAGATEPIAAPASDRSASIIRRSRRAADVAPKLIWDDEFNGPAGALPDRRRWQILTGGGGFGNDELQYYTRRRANVSLDGRGHLLITARRERYTGSNRVTRDYTSALIQTKGRFATTYGRLEARIELPAGRGLWPAFWAVGADIDQVGWPQSGEIDVMENIGSDPFAALGSIHGPQLGRRDGYQLTATVHARKSLAAGFHVYGVDWSPGRIVFTLDGVPYSVRTPASLPAGAVWEFDKPFYLILDLAVGGTVPGPPAASTRFPAAMIVDWVRVYA